MCSNDEEMKARGIVSDSFECVPLICKRRDNIRRATRRGEEKKKTLVLFVSGGNRLFFYTISHTGQLSDLKMTVSKLKSRVYRLVTGRMTTLRSTLHKSDPLGGI